MTSAVGPPSGPGRWSRGWRAFRHWRRSRPFWGGLLLMLAGFELFASANLNLGGLQVHMGFEGFLSYVLPLVLVLVGLFVWVTPNLRAFYSILGIITALYSLIGLNLGGWFLGAVLGVVGGGLAFSWMPLPPTTPSAPPPGAAADGDDPYGDERYDDERYDDERYDDDRYDDDPYDGGTGVDDHDDEAQITELLDGQEINDRLAGGSDERDPHGDVDHGDGDTPRGGGSRSYQRPFYLWAAIPMLLAVFVAGAIRAPSQAVADPCPSKPPPAATTSPATPEPAPTSAPVSSSSPAEVSSPPSIEESSPSDTLASDTSSAAVSDDPTPTPAPAPLSATTPTPMSIMASEEPTTSTDDPCAASPSPSGSGGTAGPAPGERIVAEAPGKLTASTAVLEGLTYDGVVTLPTAAGSVQVLSFSFSKATKSDFRLLASALGFTVTMRGATLVLAGNGHLYASEFTGTLNGEQFTFTPDAPPPSTLELTDLTDVSIDLYFVDCDTLDAPGLTEESAL